MNRTVTWKLCGAEVQGQGHKRNDIPCQDKTLCLFENGVRVIALADGAGSAKLSQYGAEAAIHIAAEYVANEFDGLWDLSDADIKSSIAIVIRERLALVARELSCDEKDLSSTLLLVAVKKNRYLALHVGDGVIGCMFRESLEVISKPANGEYANLTWFTTSQDFESVLRVYRGDASSISGFILMSDGVEPSLYDADNVALAKAVLNLFFVNVKSSTKETTELLKESLESVIARRTKDDCSIAMMSRSRFKRYGEYSESQRKIAKRARKDKARN